jgi:hypothetical protein
MKITFRDHPALDVLLESYDVFPFLFSFLPSVFDLLSYSRANDLRWFPICAKTLSSSCRVSRVEGGGLSLVHSVIGAVVLVVIW